MPSGNSAVGTIDIGTLIRGTLLAAVFLLLWISLRPFPDLSEQAEISASGNLPTQIVYSTLFLLVAAWCLSHEPERLLLLVRPILIATLAWFALCVITSWEPGLSARRLAFALITIGLAGMVLLLPKNIRQFSEVLATVVLVVLIVCYLGVFFAPEFSTHQATDFIEPELAGAWRGVFGHKNDAGATMVLFVFIGLFVAGVRSFVIGGTIVVLAGGFLLCTASKTSIALLPFVLAVAFLMDSIKRPRTGIALALLLLVAFNLLTIGSIYIAPIRALLDATMSDPTFTGRTDIWQFVVSHIMQRPITGYGFAAFWGTNGLLYGMAADDEWVHTASHAHNGYLDLALTIGIPGMMMVTLWLIVLPVIDYYRSPQQPDTKALSLLCLRVCLFAAYQSCFESLFMDVGQLWFFLITTAFGLRLLAVAPIAR